MLKTRTRQPYLKAVAMALLVCFTASETAWSTPLSQMSVLMPDLKTVSMRPILKELPFDLAEIQDYSASVPDASGTKPFVIYIQDAHAHAGAQHTIQRMLELLHSEAVRRKKDFYVAVEGAEGALHPEYLDFKTPGFAAGNAVADYLLQQGELTGSELFAWELYKSGDSSDLVHGVEDPELYKTNLTYYYRTEALRADLKSAVEEIRMQLLTQASKEFNKNLLNLFEYRRRWKNGQWGAGAASERMDLAKYSSELIKAAEEYAAIDLENIAEQLRFPNLIRLQQLNGQRFENSNAVSSEYEHLLLRVQELPDSRRFVKSLQSFAYLKGIAADQPENYDPDVSPRHLLEAFLYLARSGAFDVSGFLNFKTFLKTAVIENEIHLPALFDEIETLETAVFASLARSSAERGLFRRLEQLDSLDELFALKLTYEEFERIRDTGWEAYAWLAGMPASQPDDLLREGFTNALSFYEAAENRDSALVRNALALPQKGKAADSVVVMVAGGFHGEGIRRQLQELGVAHAVVQPRLNTMPAAGLYEKVMTHQHADLSRYFNTRNPFATHQQALLYRALLEAGPAALLKKDDRSSAVLRRKFLDLKANHILLKDLPAHNALVKMLLFASDGFHRFIEAGDAAGIAAGAERNELRVMEPISEPQLASKIQQYAANLQAQRDSRDGLNQVEYLTPYQRDILLVVTELIGVLARDPEESWTARAFLRDVKNFKLIQRLLILLEHRLEGVTDSLPEFEEQMRAAGQSRFFAVVDAIKGSNAFSPLRPLKDESLPFALHLDGVKLENAFIRLGSLPATAVGEVSVTDLWFAHDPFSIMGLVAAHRHPGMEPHAKGGIRFMSPLNRYNEYTTRELYYKIYGDPTDTHKTHTGVMIDLSDLVRSQDPKNILGTEFQGAKGEFTFYPGTTIDEAFKKYAALFIDAGILAHEVPGPDIGMSGQLVQTGVDEAKRILYRHLDREMEYLNLLVDGKKYTDDNLSSFQITADGLAQARSQFAEKYPGMRNPLYAYEDALRIIETNAKNIRFLSDRVAKLARTYVVRDYAKEALPYPIFIFNTTTDLVQHFYGEIIQEAADKKVVDPETLLESGYRPSKSEKLRVTVNKILGAVITGGLGSQGAIDHVISGITAKGVIVAYRRVKDYLTLQGTFSAKQKVRIGVNGAGDVGGSFALMAARGGDKVVMIQDVNGAVFRKSGFTVEELQLFNTIPPTERNVITFFTQFNDVQAFEGRNEGAKELFSGSRDYGIDVVVTAAVANTINESNVGRVIDPEGTIKAIVEGGNNTYKRVASQIAASHVIAVTGATANIGGVMASSDENQAKHEKTVVEITHPTIQNKKAGSVKVTALLNGHIEEVPLTRFTSRGAAKKGTIELHDGRVSKAHSSFPDLPVNTIVDLARDEDGQMRAYVNNYYVGDVDEARLVQRLLFKVGDGKQSVTVTGGRVENPIPALPAIRKGEVDVFFPIRERKRQTYVKVDQTIYAFQTLVLALIEPGNPQRDAVRVQQAVSHLLNERKARIYSDPAYRGMREKAIRQLMSRDYIATPEEMLHIVSADLAREELLQTTYDEKGNFIAVETIHPFTRERIRVTNDFEVIPLGIDIEPYRSWPVSYLVHDLNLNVFDGLYELLKDEAPALFASEFFVEAFASIRKQAAILAGIPKEDSEARLKGAVELFQIVYRNLSDPRFAESIERITQNSKAERVAQVAARTYPNVLRFTGIWLGYETQTLESLDLNYYLARMSDSFLLGKAVPELVLDSKVEQPIQTYAVDLARVLENLMLNALYATDPSQIDRERKIQIKTELLAADAAHPESRVAIHVVDNGTGMDTKTFQRIFEPFFTTKPAGVGNGIGLVNVKTLVEQSLGGEIKAKTAFGKGSTFTIILPFNAPEHPEARSEQRYDESDLQRGRVINNSLTKTRRIVLYTAREAREVFGRSAGLPQNALIVLLIASGRSPRITMIDQREALRLLNIQDGKYKLRALDDFSPADVVSQLKRDIQNAVRWLEQIHNGGGQVLIPQAEGETLLYVERLSELEERAAAYAPREVPSPGLVLRPAVLEAPRPVALPLTDERAAFTEELLNFLVTRGIPAADLRLMLPVLLSAVRDEKLDRATMGSVYQKLDDAVEEFLASKEQDLAWGSPERISLYEALNLFVQERSELRSNEDAENLLGAMNSTERETLKSYFENKEIYQQLQAFLRFDSETPVVRGDRKVRTQFLLFPNIFEKVDFYIHFGRYGEPWESRKIEPLEQSWTDYENRTRYTLEYELPFNAPGEYGVTFYAKPKGTNDPAFFVWQSRRENAAGRLIVDEADSVRSLNLLALPRGTSYADRGEAQISFDVDPASLNKLDFKARIQKYSDPAFSYEVQINPEQIRSRNGDGYIASVEVDPREAADYRVDFSVTRKDGTPVAATDPRFPAIVSIYKTIDQTAALVEKLQSYESFLEYAAEQSAASSAPEFSQFLFDATKNDEYLRGLVSSYYDRVMTELEDTDETSLRFKTLTQVYQIISTLGIGRDITFVTPEGPHAIGGGLGAVIRGLPNSLAEAGVPINVITNLYEEGQKNKHRSAEEVLADGVEINGKVVKPAEAGTVTIPYGPVYFAGTKNVQTPGYTIDARVYVAESGGVRFIFLRHSEMTNRLYPKVASSEELKRAIFLSRGALEITKKKFEYGDGKVLDLQPSMIYSHDWVAGLIPFFSVTDPAYSEDIKIRKMLTGHFIHNFNTAYQGRVFTNEDGYKDIWGLLNVGDEHFFGLADPNSNDFINVTASALYHSNAGLWSPSTPFAREIVTAEGGQNLHYLLRSKINRLVGISNGIELQEVRRTFWQKAMIAQKLEEYDRAQKLGELEPAERVKRLKAYRDQIQPGQKGGIANQPESPAELEDEAFLAALPSWKKTALRTTQIEYGLKEDQDAILFSFIGRVAEQKGLQLLLERGKSGQPILEEILQKYPKAQFVFGGPPAEGDVEAAEVVRLIQSLEQKYPGRIRGRFEMVPMAEALGIMFASHYFLMPSKYEPGGITQLEAMAGGTVVVGRKTGGIAATIFDYDEDESRGNGFLFEEFSGAKFSRAIQNAIDAMNAEPALKETLVRRAAEAKNDWSDRIPQYLAFFQDSAGVLAYNYPHLRRVIRKLNQIKAARSEMRSADQPLQQDVDDALRLKDAARARVSVMNRYNRELLALFVQRRSLRSAAPEQFGAVESTIRNYAESLQGYIDRLPSDAGTDDERISYEYYDRVLGSTEQDDAQKARLIQDYIRVQLDRQIRSLQSAFDRAVSIKDDEQAAAVHIQLLGVLRAKAKGQLLRARFYLQREDLNETAVLTLLAGLKNTYGKMETLYAWRWKRAIARAAVKKVWVTGRDAREHRVYDYSSFRIFENPQAADESRRVLVMMRSWVRDGDVYVPQMRTFALNDLEKGERQQIHAYESLEADYNQVQERLHMLESIRELYQLYSAEIPAELADELPGRYSYILDVTPGGLARGRVFQKTEAAQNINAARTLLEAGNVREGIELLQSAADLLSGRLEEIASERDGLQSRVDYFTHRIRKADTHRAMIEIKKLFDARNYDGALQLADVLTDLHYRPIAVRDDSYRSLKVHLSWIRENIQKLKRFADGSAAPDAVYQRHLTDRTQEFIRRTLIMSAVRSEQRSTELIINFEDDETPLEKDWQSVRGALAKYEIKYELAEKLLRSSRLIDDSNRELFGYFFHVLKMAFSQNHMISQSVTPWRLATEIGIAFSLFEEQISEESNTVKIAGLNARRSDLSEIIVVTDDSTGLIREISGIIEAAGANIENYHQQTLRSPLTGREVTVQFYEIIDAQTRKALTEEQRKKLEGEIRTAVENKIAQSDRELILNAQSKLADILQAEIAILRDPFSAGQMDLSGGRLNSMEALAYDVFREVAEPGDEEGSRRVSDVFMQDIRQLHAAVDRIVETMEEAPQFLLQNGVQVNEENLPRLRRYIDFVTAETMHLALLPLSKAHQHRQSALSIFLNIVSAQTEEALNKGEDISFVVMPEPGREETFTISVAEALYAAKVVVHELQQNFSVISQDMSEEAQLQAIDQEKAAFQEAFDEIIKLTKPQGALNQETAERLAGLNALIEKVIAPEILKRIEGQALSAHPELVMPLKAFRAIPLVVLPHIKYQRDEYERTKAQKFLDNAQDLERFFKTVIQELTSEYSIGNYMGALNSDKELVLFMREIDPYTIMALVPHYSIQGIVTDGAGQTSHGVVVAEGLGIPVYTISREEAARGDIYNEKWIGRKVILDGSRESGNPRIILNATEETWSSYAPLLETQKALKRIRDRKRFDPAAAEAGREVVFLANVEKAPEMRESSQKYGAAGVGLHRTEFEFTKQNPELVRFINAFTDNRDNPSPVKGLRESKAYDALVASFERTYSEMAQNVLVGDVGIRTFDMQRDKEDKTFKDLNPEGVYGPAYYATPLGKQLLRAQLEGAYRANAKSSRGQIKIFFPMYRSARDLVDLLRGLGFKQQTLAGVVSDTPEQDALNNAARKDFRGMITLASSVKTELAENKDKALTERQLRQLNETRIGIMVETVEGLEILDYMLPSVDFVSIGSNDLTMSLYRELGINREDDQKYTNQIDSRVLTAIRDQILNVVSAHNAAAETKGETKRVNVTVCGAIACVDTFVAVAPQITPANVQFELSGSAFLIPALKEIVRYLRDEDVIDITAENVNELAQNVLERVRERQLASEEYAAELQAVRDGVPEVKVDDPRAAAVRKQAAPLSEPEEFSLEEDLAKMRVEQSRKALDEHYYLLGPLGFHFLPANTIATFAGSKQGFSVAMINQAGDSFEISDSAQAFRALQPPFAVVRLKVQGSEEDVEAFRQLLKTKVLEPDADMLPTFNSEFASGSFTVDRESWSPEALAPRIEAALELSPGSKVFASVNGSTREITATSGFEILLQDGAKDIELSVVGPGAETALKSLAAVNLSGKKLLAQTGDLKLSGTLEESLAEKETAAEVETAAVEAAPAVKSVEKFYVLSQIGFHFLPINSISGFAAKREKFKVTMYDLDGRAVVISDMSQASQALREPFTVVRLVVEGTEDDLAAFETHLKTKVVEPDADMVPTFGEHFAAGTFSADKEGWTIEDLQPRVEAALELFLLREDLKVFAYAEGTYKQITAAKGFEVFLTDEFKDLKLVVTGEGAETALTALAAIAKDGKRLFTSTGDVQSSAELNRNELRSTEPVASTAVFSEELIRRTSGSRLRILAAGFDQVEPIVTDAASETADLFSAQATAAYFNDETVTVQFDGAEQTLDSDQAAVFWVEYQIGRRLQEQQAGIENPLMQQLVNQIKQAGDPDDAFNTGADIHLELAGKPENLNVFIPALALIADLGGGLHLNMQDLTEDEAGELQNDLYALLAEKGIRLTERQLTVASAQQTEFVTLPARRLKTGERHGVLGAAQNVAGVKPRRGVNIFKLDADALVNEELLSATLVTVIHAMALDKNLEDYYHVLNPREMFPDAFAEILSVVSAFLQAQTRISASA